jgi:hypothetical protein
VGGKSHLDESNSDAMHEVESHQSHQFYYIMLVTGRAFRVQDIHGFAGGLKARSYAEMLAQRDRF